MLIARKLPASAASMSIDQGFGPGCCHTVAVTQATPVAVPPPAGRFSDPGWATRPTVSAKAWRGLAVASSGAVLVSFNATATNIAFDDLTRSFPDAGQSIVAWTSSGFFIGLAGFMLVGGRLADRTGRRRIFRLGLAGFVVSAVLSAAAPTVWVLIAARVLQAISGAFVLPASLAMILPDFPKERHGTAVGVWAAMGPIASAIAPSASAAMLELGSWRWLYFLTAPIAGLTLLFGWGSVNESKADSTPGRLDLVGALQGTTAITVLVFAVSQGPMWGWGHPVVVGCFIAALLLLPAFVFRSRRHPAPLLNLTLFGERPVWTANLANAFVHLAGMSMWLMWPLYMSRVWGWDKLAIGVALTPGPVFSGIATGIGGTMADRYGYKWMLRIGSLILVGGMAWQWYWIDADASYLESLFLPIAAMGTGWALVAPQLNSALLKHVHSDYWGEANAGFNTVRNVAAALGIAVAVGLVGESSGAQAGATFEPLWQFYLVVMALAALVVWLLVPSAQSNPGKRNGSQA